MVADTGAGLAPARDDDRIEEASRADLFWHDFQHRLVELELTACTRAAAAVLTAASILLAAHVALAPQRSKVVVLLELGAAGAALAVLMPTRWTVWQNRPDLIRKHFAAMVRKKWIRLWVAWGLLIAALLAWFVPPFIQSL